MRHCKFEDLNSEQQKLLLAAEDALKLSYCPYSHFSAAAALLCPDGTVLKAANVENASYNVTICAERSALVHANALGHRVFDAIAVIGKGKEFDSIEPVAPCGICRQMLFEAAQLGKGDMEVIMSNTRKDRIVVGSIKELLPLGFGPKDLKIDVTEYRPK
jgi:cytidine deaminase